MATALEKAMTEFFDADDIDDIRWANGDNLDYKTHGRYLIAMHFGMSKEDAYKWVTE